MHAGLNISYPYTYTHQQSAAAATNGNSTAIFKDKKTHTFTAQNRTSHYLVMQAGGVRFSTWRVYIRIKYSRPITYITTRDGKCLVYLANSQRQYQYTESYLLRYNAQYRRVERSRETIETCWKSAGDNKRPHGRFQCTSACVQQYIRKRGVNVCINNSIECRQAS